LRRIYRAFADKKHQYFKTRVMFDKHSNLRRLAREAISYFTILRR